MQRGKKRSVGSLSTGKTMTQPAWKAGLQGLCLSWILTLVGLFLAATIIYWQWIDSDLIPAAAKIVMILSMLAGGMYIFKKTQGKERIWILIMLIVYLAIRFLMSLILTF